MVFCFAWKSGVDRDSSLAFIFILAAFPGNGFRIHRKRGLLELAAFSSLLSLLLPDPFGLRIFGPLHHHRKYVAGRYEPLASALPARDSSSGPLSF